MRLARYISVSALLVGIAAAQITNPSGAGGGASGQFSTGSATYTGTTFFPPGGGGPGSGTEGPVQVAAPVAGSYSNLAVKLGTAPGASNSLAFTFRKNGADTQLTCTISNAATACSDVASADSFTVAVGDAIDIKAVATGTPAATTISILWATPGLPGATGAAGSNGASYTATSTTSMTVGMGNVTFTTQANTAYAVGGRVRISSSASPTNYMEGLITAYSGTSMTVNRDLTNGSGTFASWNLNIAGNVGTSGAVGPPGPAGPAYGGTSTTLVAIGTGTVNVTTQAGLAYQAGARVRLSSNANGANYMEGLIVSYSGTALSVNVDTTGGSGQFSDWNINIAGNQGSQGPTGGAGPAGPGYTATSTTSITIGTGSATFTTQAGLAYSAGARARASSAANTANYMEGSVTSYSGTTLVINVDTVGGSGSHADWNLNVAGNVGNTGATGAQGSTGAGNNTFCADATGSTTTYACPTPSPAVSTLTGLIVTFKPQTTNGTCPCTLNVSSLGAKTLKQSDGATDISAAALVGGTSYLFSYDGTNLTQSSSAGSGGGSPAGSNGDVQTKNGTSFGTAPLNKNADSSLNASKAITWASAYKPTFNAAGTTTCDLSQSNVCEVDFGAGNTTLALTNPHANGLYMLRSCQDAVGGRVYTAFPANAFGFLQPDPSAGTTNCTEGLFDYDGANFQGHSTNVPGATWHGISCPEGAAPTAVSGTDQMYCSSANHRWVMQNNGGSPVQVVAAGVDINNSDQVTSGAHLGAGTVPVAALASTGTTVNGQTCTLGSTCTVSGGTNTQTGSYALVAGDLGKLVIMNCASACTATLFGSPTNGYYGAILSIGSTVATISLNGKNYNGAASIPALNSFRPLYFWSDGTNYFGDAPLVQGSNVTITPSSNGLTIASTGGGGGGSGETYQPIGLPNLPIPLPLGVNVISSVTVANTNTATSLIGSSYVGSATLPGNSGAIGRSFEIKAFGTFSTDVTVPTLSFTVLVGGVTIGTLTPALGATQFTNDAWQLDYVFTITGLTGVSGGGCFDRVGASGAVAAHVCTFGGTANLDFTTDQVVDLQATWGTANANNSITGNVVTVRPF